jgi:hypothetical protein
MGDAPDHLVSGQGIGRTGKTSAARHRGLKKSSGRPEVRSARRTMGEYARHSDRTGITGAQNGAEDWARLIA